MIQSNEYQNILGFLLHRDELMRMLAEDELREAVLLIFANKQASIIVYLLQTNIRQWPQIFNNNV